MVSAMKHEAVLWSLITPEFVAHIVDIPRSIELAQGSNCNHRIISVPPIEKPFASLEPKSEKARASFQPTTIEERCTQKFLNLFVEHFRKYPKELWCLPRTLAQDDTGEVIGTSGKRRGAEEESTRRKRPRADIKEDVHPVCARSFEQQLIAQGLPTNQPILVVPGDSQSNPIELEGHTDTLHVSKQNRVLPWLRNQQNIDEDKLRIKSTSHDSSEQENEPLATLKNSQPFQSSSAPLLLTNSMVLNGDIASTIDSFKSSAPLFDFILMDPPWPNRSARRKGEYGVSRNFAQIKDLLTSLPLKDHISDNGYIAVWITNKESFRQLILEMFHDWGVTFIGEWTWLKVTTHGEPICAIDGFWRKPYETLLVAQMGGKAGSMPKSVLFSVPDLHSRKPSAALIKEIISGTVEGQSLEIFARNLTEGWWCWGNEVLKYQDLNHWVMKDEKKEETPTESREENPLYDELNFDEYLDLMVNQHE